MASESEYEAEKMGANDKVEATFHDGSKFDGYTPAQKQMREDIESSREPVTLRSALDDLFGELERKMVERRAEEVYPSDHLNEAERQQGGTLMHRAAEHEAFIAGAEWWAKYGIV